MARWLVCAFVLACSLAQAQTPGGKTTWYFRVGPSFGQPVLGSEDTRRGTLYAVGYSNPDPRISIRGLQGDLMVEGYYLFTKGGGFEDIPVNEMKSYGVMVTARYYTHWLRGARAHFDLGFGAVYNSFTTRDLDTQFNTTPGVAVGASWSRYDFTIRWYHASNGGTSGNNQGTNQIQYLFTYKF